MVFDFNNNKARKNQMKIFSVLQGEGSPFGFIDLKTNSRLHQITLSKYLKLFVKSDFIEKIGDNKRKKYQITDKGLSEYRKLLAEENIEKINSKFPVLDKVNLMDSVKIEKINIKTEQGTFSCQGVSSVSGVLNEEKRDLIKEEIIEKIMPVILRHIGDISASGSVTIGFCKEEKKKNLNFQVLGE